MGAACGNRCVRGQQHEPSFSLYIRSENSNTHRSALDKSLPNDGRNMVKSCSPSFKPITEFGSPCPVARTQSEESLDLDEELTNHSKLFKFNLRMVSMGDGHSPSRGSPGRSPTQRQNFQLMVQQQQAQLMLQQVQMEQAMRIQLHNQMKHPHRRQSRPDQLRSQQERPSQHSPRRKGSDQNIHVINTFAIQSPKKHRTFVQVAQSVESSSPDRVISPQRRPIIRTQQRQDSKVSRSHGGNFSFAGSQDSLHSQSQTLRHRLVDMDPNQADIYSYRGRNRSKNHTSILKKKTYNQTSSETFSLRKSKKVRFSMVPHSPPQKVTFK